MVEGNLSELVQLSKTQILIERGFGLTLPQLAAKHGLSPQQMKSAMVDMGILKDDPKEESGELTAREQKFLDVCTAHNIETEELQSILDDLGMEYKTGRRSTKGQKKYIIIDDYKTNEA